ncbi:GntR family transcriptional regulator [Oceanospirillum linum]|uniref:GntR family transcriptional regulator n=1 Tax=Oceanospirillum linum TaxID=966 RepID=UPI00089E6708|nr:winged helix-turn-helix domain-containing protein [Oceanospirillum linum]SEG14525.1 regulatory protein, gntR family [Oleiphilus messinensis]SMP10809.1 regulatory protein, gntR family [Oceanospirillum linum]
MRYQGIAEQIIDDIQADKLAHGSRMPSLRKLAQQFNVSMTTAINTYHYLEELGWIIAKPQSGFYVSRPPAGG